MVEDLIETFIKEFSLQLKHFDPLTYYQNAPQFVKKCNKSINRKVMKNKIFCRLNLNYNI